MAEEGKTENKNTTANTQQVNRRTSNTNNNNFEITRQVIDNFTYVIKGVKK